jgi:hypothetical protein
VWPGIALSERKATYVQTCLSQSVTGYPAVCACAPSDLRSVHGPSHHVVLRTCARALYLLLCYCPLLESAVGLRRSIPIIGRLTPARAWCEGIQGHTYIGARAGGGYTATRDNLVKLDEVCRPSRGNNGVQLEPRSPAPWRRCRPARPPRPSAAAMRAGEWRRH